MPSGELKPPEKPSEQQPVARWTASPPLQRKQQMQVSAAETVEPQGGRRLYGLYECQLYLLYFTHILWKLRFFM